MYYHFKPELPSVEVLKEVRLQTPMRVYSQDGELISQFGEKRRIPLTLDEMPPKLIQAFLATEDNRFYEHPGIDFIGVARAAFTLLTTGQKKQGASTITMQLARNFFLTREKTYIRKIKEIFIAWHIEQLLTKDEILELYLNKIELGNRAFGVGAAAQVYYGKEAKDLTLAQIAVIAGLPKAPSTLNPIASPERAKARRAVVLGRMLETGYITDQEYQQAKAAPITAKYHGAQISLGAPYVAEMVRQQMVQLFGEENAYGEGYQVYTTISGDRQRAAEAALIDNLLAYDSRHGWRGAVEKIADWPLDDAAIDKLLKRKASYKPLVPAVVIRVEEQQAHVRIKDQGNAILAWDAIAWARPYINDNKQGPNPKTALEVLAEGDLIYVRPTETGWWLAQLPDANAGLVALNPEDGAIEALVGGFSFKLSKYNRVEQAKRQVGSNIKPFVYAAAFERGFTLASLINDAPINQWDRSQGYAWRPKNSPPVYNGPTRLRLGLAQSKNVMSVRLLRAVGIDNVIEQLTRFGFAREELPRNESISLGSASLTPLEVARGFAAFANGGFLVEPYLISRIEDGYGKLIWQASPKLACLSCEQALAREEWVDPLQANEAELQEQLQPDAMTTPEMDAGWPRQCPIAPIGINKLAPRAISAQTAFLVSQAMESVIWGGGNWNQGTGWNGTGWRAQKTVKRHDIAGKTGTTNEAKDAWFSGFNPELVATSWIGFDDHRRELGKATRNPAVKGDQIFGKEFGARTAQPAWNAFMAKALEGIPEQELPMPTGIVSMRIDRATGKLTRRRDHSSRFEYFAAGTEPKEFIRDSLANPFDGPALQVTEDETESEELF
ncbi:PBP1A family penicillin-binding protein [Gallaecimonas sp. GXIMD4217]|uniref:penicillin-binding protein 1A n=1 Tax=Gallaecimonas sp. GXIMD4217 TaxID=3131927 RepID=UPI00311B18B2